jgi:hypothetical protein
MAGPYCWGAIGTAASRSKLIAKLLADNPPDEENPMETNPRRVGRPKSPPRTGPLVLGEDQGRTKVTFEISDPAAGELAEYAQWVEECAGVTAGEATFKTVDFALREIFRRDRVWQAKRRPAAKTQRAAPASVVAPAPAPRPAAAIPPLPTAPSAARGTREWRTRGRRDRIRSALTPG